MFKPDVKTTFNSIPNKYLYNPCYKDIILAQIPSPKNIYPNSLEAPGAPNSSLKALDLQPRFYGIIDKFYGALLSILIAWTFFKMCPFKFYTRNKVELYKNKRLSKQWQNFDFGWTIKAPKELYHAQRHCNDKLGHSSGAANCLNKAHNKWNGLHLCPLIVCQMV